MAIVRENEEKKRYLNGYRDCTRRERQLQEQIDELRSQQMYLMGKAWEQIAVEMNYSYRFILKIHGKALGNFEIPKRGH